MNSTVSGTQEFQRIHALAAQQGAARRAGYNLDRSGQPYNPLVTVRTPHSVPSLVELVGETPESYRDYRLLCDRLGQSPKY